MTGAKRKALQVIKGNHVAQYSQLRDYVNAVKKAMPDSTIDLALDELEGGLDGRRFKRIYVCLGPLRRGFTKGCRPIIGIDNCHLKGPFGGQLLTAVGCYLNALTTIIPNATIVPNAEHRFCVMHLYRNMYKDHKRVGRMAAEHYCGLQQDLPQNICSINTSELQKVLIMLVTDSYYLILII